MAVTFGRESPMVVGDENLVAALSRLPPEALRLESATAVSLHALGIRTIGILLKIPRDQLVSRFGTALLQRIDQATGAVHEPLNWLPHRTAIQAEIEFDGIVESLETLHMALRQILDRVVEVADRPGIGSKTTSSDIASALCVAGGKDLWVTLHPPGKPRDYLSCCVTRWKAWRRTMASTLYACPSFPPKDWAMNSRALIDGEAGAATPPNWII